MDWQVLQMPKFSARLDVLPAAQRRLWGELSVVPNEFTLYGGTAPKLPRLAPSLTAKDNGLHIASLLDIAGIKASVLQVRAEAKDYIDMDALIQIGGVGLPFALAAAEKLYGPSFNPEITLKALSYFEDGDLRELPTDVKFRLANAVNNVDLDHLPSIEDFRASMDRGRGLDP